MISRKQLWNNTLDVCESGAVLNLFNPIFWAFVIIVIVLKILHNLFWVWTLRKQYKRIKEWAFLRSNHCDSDWTRKCYKNLYGPSWNKANDKTEELRKKHIKSVLKVRLRLIRKAR